MLPSICTDPRRPRRAPLAALVLALVLVITFLGDTALDPARRTAALDHYQDSGLAAIELPRYRDFLASHPEDPRSERQLARLGAASPQQATELLLADPQFERVVRAGLLLPEGDPGLPHWRAARARFDDLMSLTAVSRWSLSRAHIGEPWRFITYPVTGSGAGATFVCALALFLLGSFAEGVLGALRLALAVLAATAAAGAAGLLVTAEPLCGPAPVLAALAGMVLALHGSRPVWLGFWPRSAPVYRVPALASWSLWALGLATMVGPALASGLLGALLAMQLAAFLAGALLARALLPDPDRASYSARPLQDRPATISTSAPAPVAAQGSSRLEREAQEAASRLDTARAARIYQELIGREPERVDLLGAYLNVALHGADEELLRDAALRVLWSRVRSASDDLRRIFLQLTQPKVLRALPFDEHLRLSRRLVRHREDAAALRVLDGLLEDEHLRQLYGRQLADCLLGLFSAYSRHNMTAAAEQVRERLVRHFESPEQLGGLAPTLRPPPTLFTDVMPTRAHLSLVPPPSATVTGREGPATVLRTGIGRTP